MYSIDTKKIMLNEATLLHIYNAKYNALENELKDLVQLKYHDAVFQMWEIKWKLKQRTLYPNIPADDLEIIEILQKKVAYLESIENKSIDEKILLLLTKEQLEKKNPYLKYISVLNAEYTELLKNKIGENLKIIQSDLSLTTEEILLLQIENIELQEQIKERKFMNDPAKVTINSIEEAEKIAKEKHKAYESLIYFKTKLNEAYQVEIFGRTVNYNEFLIYIKNLQFNLRQLEKIQIINMLFNEIEAKKNYADHLLKVRTYVVKPSSE